MRRDRFRANPIPRACSVLIFAKKIREDELKRGERIRKNAEIAYAKANKETAKMMPTMLKHAERKKQEPVKKLQEEYSFKPDIGPEVTGKQLKEKAERFHRELLKKKGQKTQTKPSSPNFVKRPTKILDRSYINEGESSKPTDKALAAMKKLAQAPRGEETQAEKNPMSTKAVQMSQAKRREDILAKKKQEEAQKKSEDDR